MRSTSRSSCKLSGRTTRVGPRFCRYALPRCSSRLILRNPYPYSSHPASLFGHPCSCSGPGILALMGSMLYMHNQDSLALLLYDRVQKQAQETHRTGTQAA